MSSRHRDQHTNDRLYRVPPDRVDHQPSFPEIPPRLDARFAPHIGAPHPVDYVRGGETGALSGAPPRQYRVVKQTGVTPDPVPVQVVVRPESDRKPKRRGEGEKEGKENRHHHHQRRHLKGRNRELEGDHAGRRSREEKKAHSRERERSEGRRSSKTTASGPREGRHYPDLIPPPPPLPPSSIQPGALHRHADVDASKRKRPEISSQRGVPLDIRPPARQAVLTPLHHSARQVEGPTTMGCQQTKNPKKASGSTVASTVKTLRSGVASKKTQEEEKDELPYLMSDSPAWPCVWASQRVFYCKLQLAVETPNSAIVVDARNESQCSLQHLTLAKPACSIYGVRTDSPEAEEARAEKIRKLCNWKTVLVYDNSSSSSSRRPADAIKDIIDDLIRTQSQPKEVVILDGGLTSFVGSYTTCIATSGVDAVPGPIEIYGSKKRDYSLWAWDARNLTLPAAHVFVDQFGLQALVSFSSSDVAAPHNAHLLRSFKPEEFPAAYPAAVDFIKGIAEKGGKPILMVDSMGGHYGAAVAIWFAIETARISSETALQLVCNRRPSTHRELESGIKQGFRVLASSLARNTTLQEARKEAVAAIVAASPSPSPATSPEPPAFMTKGDALPERGQWLVDELKRKLSPNDFEASMKTVGALFSNIITHPVEGKYRMVKLSNPRFMETAGRHNECLELLKMAGWVMDEEHGVISLPPSALLQPMRDLLSQLPAYPNKRE